MAVTWLIMFTYLHRHPHLLREGVTAAFFRTERLRAIAGIIAPFVPVIIGRVVPAAGSVALMAQALRFDPQAPLQGRHGEVQPERPAGSRRGHLWPGT
jgi:hypothetical protein